MKITDLELSITGILMIQDACQVQALLQEYSNFKVLFSSAFVLFILSLDSFYIFLCCYFFVFSVIVNLNVTAQKTYRVYLFLNRD